MAIALSTLVTQVRRYVRDYAETDALTAALASTTSTVTLTVADGTIYGKGFPIEIDQETMLVTANGSGTSVTVRRATQGSTSASHASGAPVLIRPAFTTAEIVLALNAAKDDCYPQIYKPVLDTSLTAATNTYEYTVPALPLTYNGDTLKIPYISKLEILLTGDTNYRELRQWRVRRGATPKIQLLFNPSPGTLRVHGYGPFPDLAATTDTLDAQWPKPADKVLITGAAAQLLGSGEAGRVRVDTGAHDDREQANRTGSSLQVSGFLYNRFLRQLASVAPAPMPPHVIPTF